MHEAHVMFPIDLSIKKMTKVKKLSDGRTIGGAGRLTETLCDGFQNYYGQAIRNNIGDLEGMK